jgi:phosphate binding protein
MKHNRLYAAVSFGVIMLLLAGCGQREGQSPQGTGTATGSITVIGSTALQPLAEQAAVQFRNDNPNANILVQGGGSGSGLTAVSQGTAQIGNSDIFAEEKSGIDAKAIEDHKVCVAGFAVIVNPKVTMSNLTKQQLIDIFTGKVDNWNKVGGNDMSITIINRPTSSGTRATFKKYALGGAEEAAGKALTEDSSGAVLKAVGDTAGSISYIGLSYIKNNTSIKALTLDGVEANVQNITTGKYPLWSYEHMYTRGAAQGLSKSFIDYVMSDKVKPLIQGMGYIPISDMKVSR